METADVTDEDGDRILTQNLTKNREDRGKYKYSGLGHLDGRFADEPCGDDKYFGHPKAAPCLLPRFASIENDLTVYLLVPASAMTASATAFPLGVRE